ncbi:hypothetical protein E7V67_021130 [[Empedobacter] haloabium]|uniref:Uncharacterized protein n=1 Tax=[Empedobacter] haloabium TaxID=592317 RepID=A0ABZ1UJA8_9BURK
MTNIVDIVEGCDSFPSESWALLFARLAVEQSLYPKRTYTSPAERFAATVRVQDRTTSEAGIEKWGFSELLSRLSALPASTTLRVEEFGSKEFAARCVFTSDTSKLLGCTIVRKSQNVMQTPPAWDGSLEALRRFNTPPK